MSEGPATFIADAMLGKLARWLRLAGYDTVYDTLLTDRQLADLARRSGRLLLTRDRELAGRRGVKSLLIDSDRVLEQLAQVVGACALSDYPARPRCPLCNGILEDLPANGAPPSVPDAVRVSGVSLRRCQACGHVYWSGSHWAGIRRGLEASRVGG